jgi:hypothetical protein
LAGNQGDILKQSLKITNEDTQEAILALSIQGFSISEEDGSVILDGEQKLPSQITKWISFEKKGMNFNPKETKIINFQIEIPKDAMPGGQYAAIVVSMDRVQRDKGQSSGSARVVSLLMLTVSGDIRENATIKDFKTIKHTNSYTFELTMKNNGNNHIKPQGHIVITNLWGTKIGEVALNGENILPGFSRKIQTEWKPEKKLFGQYTATLISNYGSKKTISLSAANSFLAWSNYFIWILLLIAVALLIKYKSFLKIIRKLLKN